MGGKDRKKGEFYGSELEVVSVCIHFYVVSIKSLRFLLLIPLNNRNIKATHTPGSLLDYR